MPKRPTRAIKGNPLTTAKALGPVLAPMLASAQWRLAAQEQQRPPAQVLPTKKGLR
jgi:hypothetical protein